MSVASNGLPRSFLAALHRVEDPLLVRRYGDALGELELPRPRLRRFHVDAAGYSPEVAQELGDPLYLAAGPLAAHGILVSPQQLGAQLVHPALGAATTVVQKVLASHEAALRRLLLREAVVLDLVVDGPPVRRPRQLADVRGVRVTARTPGGLLEELRRLEDMKEEFLDSERLWLDDDYIASMSELAERARGAGPFPEALAESTHPLTAVHVPQHESTYVLKRDGSASWAHVLSGACVRTSGRRTETTLRPLTARSAVKVLRSESIADFDVGYHRRQPGALRRLQHWLAFELVLERYPSLRAGELSLRDLTSRLMRERDLPRDYLELEELRRALGSRRRDVDFDDWSPLTQLRLLVPRTRRKAQRRLVRHLQACLDPADLSRCWRDAPDIFFLNAGDLPVERLKRLAAWLKAKG